MSILRDPRDVERQVDELRARMTEVLNDAAVPEQDRRDNFMRLSGEVQALEVQARELREFELATVKATVHQAGDRDSSPQASAEQSAFRGFVRSGDVTNAALMTTPDANGGFLMPTPVRQELLDLVRKSNPIAAEATIFNLSKPGTFQVELPRKTGATTGAWVGELDARPATNAPTFGRDVLSCFEWSAQPEATQSSLDAIEGAEQLILDDIAATFNELFATALVVGTGDANKQPTGLFTGTTTYTTKLSSGAGALDAAQILGAYFSLPAIFLPGAKWYMSGPTLAILSALAWPNLVNTPLVRWETGSPTIMGKPVVMLDDAPAIGGAAYPVAFGDVKAGYAVGMHTQISTLRDPFTNKPYVRFYTTGRAGGRPWNPKAMLLLKSNNA